MRRRITALLAAAAIAAVALVAQASPASSGAGGPIGYTYIAEALGDTPLCSFFAIDLSTGVGERVNEQPLPCVDGLTFAPDGTLYGYSTAPAIGPVSETRLVTIDPATGAQEVVEPNPLPTVFFGSGGMTFDATGNLWLYAAADDPECQTTGSPWCLWQVDPTTAETTFQGIINEGVGVFGLAGTCSGEVQAIATPVGTGLTEDNQLMRVDTSTGAVTEIVGLQNLELPGGLDYDAAGGLWGIGGLPVQGTFLTRVQIFSIDPATGATESKTVLVNNDDIIGEAAGLAISPISPCPEPPPPAPEVILQPTFTG